MTDWAKYPLEVMARGMVLNDEEVREMCAEIARLREEYRPLNERAKATEKGFATTRRYGTSRHTRLETNCAVQPFTLGSFRQSATQGNLWLTLDLPTVNLDGGKDIPMPPSHQRPFTQITANRPPTSTPKTPRSRRWWRRWKRLGKTSTK